MKTKKTNASETTSAKDKNVRRLPLGKALAAVGGVPMIWNFVAFSVNTAAKSRVG